MQHSGLIFTTSIAALIVCGPSSLGIEAETDTPVMLPEMVTAQPVHVEGEAPWSAPSYTGQEQALGYSADTFAVPKGMEERVQFWINIYTKYTKDQGLLHDSRYVNLIYESVDFSDINQNITLTARQIERYRRQRVKQAKHLIEERLRRLQNVTGPEGLDGDDLRYWKLFESVSEPNKFREAAQKGRLRFQLGQRDQFMSGIYQSGRYLRQMEDIFRQEGLPIELTRLVFVESSFNLKARSKVGASGIWQFMRSTARSYMRLDNSVDERNDPLRATRAAAKKLRDNYMMLETWPLAVTAYNHGPNGMRRLVQKFSTKDIAELTDVRKGRFGFASSSFYASFLAALVVERTADRHFGPLKRMPEQRGEEVALSRDLPVKQLLSWFDGQRSTAEMMNPHIRSSEWPNGIVSRKSFIRVPIGRSSEVLAFLEGRRALVVQKSSDTVPRDVTAREKATGDMTTAHEAGVTVPQPSSTPSANSIRMAE